MTQLGRAPLTSIVAIASLVITDGQALQSATITLPSPTALDYGVYVTGLVHAAAPTIALAHQIWMLPTDVDTSKASAAAYTALGTATLTQTLNSEGYLLGTFPLVDVATVVSTRQVGVYVPYGLFFTVVMVALGGANITAGTITLVPWVGDDTV